MSHQTSQPPTPHEVLYAHLRAWNYCDVLIDRMAGFPFQDEVEALDDPAVHRCMLNDPIFAESPDQAPLLLRLPWTQIELLEKHLTYALEEAADPDTQTRTVCAFLFSPLTQPKLAKLLTRQLNTSVQDVGNIYFRYFDPRVVRHLSRILNKSQLSDLLHGVQAWLHVDWGGQLDVIAPEPQDTVSRLTLTAVQWRQMRDIESFNIALRLLKRIKFQERKSDMEYEERLFVAIRDATMAGLSMPEDQGTYAAYAVEHGKNFALHPRLPDAINVVTQHEVRFSDALDAYVGVTPSSISFSKIS